MLAFVIASLIALSGLAALAVIGVSAAAAVPQVRGLRRQLATVGDVRSVRFRIVATIVQVDDGKVVALPVRERSLLQSGMRAAA